GGEVEIEQALVGVVPKIEALRAAYSGMAAVHDSLELYLTKEEVNKLATSLSDLATAAKAGMAEDLLPQLLPDSDKRGEQTERVLKRLATLQNRSQELVGEFEGKIRPGLAVTPEVRKESERIFTTLR